MKKKGNATQTFLANFIKKKQIHLSILTQSSYFPSLKFILFLFSLIDFDFTAIFVILQKENQKIMDKGKAFCESLSLSLMYS